MTSQAALQAELREARETIRELEDELRATNQGVVALTIEQARQQDGMLHDLQEELNNTSSGLVALTIELEQRTSELEAATQELEAFSYSVSHDLRSPLRAMDGFSRALLDDYLGVLDERGHRYLRRIQANSQRMNEIIEGLLQLSGVSRTPIERVEIDLSAMCKTVCADLSDGNPDRHVRFSIEDDVTGIGDPALIRVVLGNLLGNAWKFTGNEEEATVEFGIASDPEGPSVYFVRDNGTGFDMERAQQLFRVFQRLHSPADFEGSGIGLATVHRIIERHGGTIWADSSPGLGTTFYFTLQGD